MKTACDSDPVTRIAIVTDDDSLWSLATWERVLPVLAVRPGLLVAGVWCTPPKFGKTPPSRVPFWYLRTFGVWSFVLLGAFSVIAGLRRFLGGVSGRRPATLADLCRMRDLPFYRAETPNAPEVAQWVRDHGVDILVIMGGHIVRNPLLGAPNLGTINKHAAVLPSNKGVFPFLWAHLKGEAQGISFHVVTPEIDGGVLLAQEQVEGDVLDSMLAFHVYVLDRYADMLCLAVENLVAGRTIHHAPGIQTSYQSFPSRAVYRDFKAKGGRIARLKDLLLAFRI